MNEDIAKFINKFRGLKKVLQADIYCFNHRLKMNPLDEETKVKKEYAERLLSILEAQFKGL